LSWIYSVLLDDGEIYEFNRVEQRAWNYLVVPFLCKIHSKLSANKKQESSNTLTRSELRQLNEDRNALKVAAVRIEKDRLELNAPRQSLFAFQRRLADQEQIHLELARNHTVACELARALIRNHTVACELARALIPIRFNTGIYYWSCHCMHETTNR